MNMLHIIDRLKAFKYSTKLCKRILSKVILLYLLLPPILSSATLSITAKLALEKPGDTEVSVYFCPENCMSELVQLIDSSRKSIRMAMYSLNAPPVVSALIKAHKRGINVEILLDENKTRLSFNNPNKFYQSAYPKLTTAGIPVKQILYGRNMSFHHKFMLLDNDRVLTGSLNFNNVSIDKMRENFFLHNNEKISALYHAYFEERWNKNPLKEELQSEFYSKDMDIYFGPGKNFPNGLINTINQAKKTIQIAVVVFYYQPIVDALLAAAKRGVEIKVIMKYNPAYPFYTQQEQATQQMLKAGIQVYMSKIVMHHKFTIVDNMMVASGSPGYDLYPMTRTHDDYAVIRNKDIAEVFYNEFTFINKSSQLISMTQNKPRQKHSKKKKRPMRKLRPPPRPIQPNPPPSPKSENQKKQADVNNL